MGDLSCAFIQMEFKNMFWIYFKYRVFRYFPSGYILNIGCSGIFLEDLLQFWYIHRERILLLTCLFISKMPQTLAEIHWNPSGKGQGSLSKVAKFGLFPCTILYKSCLFYPCWQVTSFERPPSWVAFIEGFHCTCIQNMVIVSCVSAWPQGKIYLDFILLQMKNYTLQMISIFSWPHWGYVGSNANF